MKKLLFILLVIFTFSGQGYAQWTENFDAGLEMPAGWHVINQGDEKGWVVNDQTYVSSHSSPNVVSISYSAMEHDDYLVMPAITVQTGVNDQISFWVKSALTSYLESYEVRLSTTVNDDTSAFNVVLQAEENAPGDWTMKTFSLADYNGQTVYVAIRATGTNMYRLDVDDVVNEAYSSCIKPTNLSSADIEAYSVNLSWTDENNANEWTIEYGEEGFAQGNGTMVTVTENPYVLMDLNPNTTYDWYVKANCSEAESNWSAKASFTTLPSCLQPTQLSSADVEAYNVTLSWMEENEAIEWTIEYGEMGFAQGNGTMVTVSENPYTLTGLTANTNYDWYVRANCSAEDQSAWSMMASFKTLPSCLKPTNLMVSDIDLTMVTLAWTDENNATAWTIEYGEAGFEQGNGTMITVTENPYTLTGLSASEDYEWHIKANCSDEDQSEWSDMNQFSTSCATVNTFPFNEDFSAGILPNCWVQEYVGDSQMNWMFYTNDAYVYSLSQMNNGKATKLVLPEMDLSNLDNPTLVYKHKQAKEYGYQDELRVYYKTSADGEWTLLQEFTNDIQEYIEEEVELPNPSATYFIAFEAKSNYGGGVHIDNVEVKGDDVVVTTPEINVTPDNHDFGMVELGQSATKTFTITNEGTATLTVSGITLSGNAAFTTNGTSTAIAPNGNYTFDVVFMPTATGMVSATITIENNSATPTVMVTVSGTGEESVTPTPEIAVNPTSHDFGMVELGQSVTKTFTVTNDGTATLTISGITLSGNAAFTTNGTSTAIVPNGNYTFDVVFMPTVTGMVSATITIANDSATPTVMVAVSGTGEEVSGCDAITDFPFMEDFSGEVIPDCWTQEYVGNSDLDWKINPYDNAVEFTSNFQEDTGEVTKLILPEMNLSNLTSPTLTYSHKQSALMGNQDELRVYYKTSEAGEWMLLQTFTGNISNYETETVILPNPSSTYFIAFEGTNNYGLGVRIDNVEVKEGEAVVVPTELVWQGAESDDWFTAANWDMNAVPGATTTVTIPGYVQQFPTITEEAICKKIIFEEGATLLGFDKLTVVENAFFYQLLTGGTAKDDPNNAIYHHVSAPVANTSAGSVFPLSAYLRQYNETTQMWENLLAADVMVPGKGYNLWMPEGDANIMYQGALNKEAIEYNGLTLTGDVNNYSGWHLLGNPYPAAIDMDNLMFPAEMQHSVSVWSSQNGGYITWNGSEGDLTDGIIPVSQGFFVKVNENNVNFTISPDACVHNNAMAYNKSDRKVIAINVKNNSNQYNETVFIAFAENGDNNYDVFDVVKLDGLEGAPALYTMIDDMRIKINSRYSASNMPLYFNTNVTGSFTLKVTDLNLRGEATIEDTFTGAMIPATADATYEFTANADDDMARFVVHFKGFTNVEDEDLNINVYADRQQVVVNNQTSEEAVIMLYNMAGQLIEVVRTMDVETRINVEVKGAYFVTVKNSKAVQTEKVIIK